VQQVARRNRDSGSQEERTHLLQPSDLDRSDGPLQPEASTHRGRGHGQLSRPPLRHPGQQPFRQGHVRGRLSYRARPQHRSLHREDAGATDCGWRGLESGRLKGLQPRARLSVRHRQSGGRPHLRQHRGVRGLRHSQVQGRRLRPDKIRSILISLSFFYRFEN